MSNSKAETTEVTPVVAPKAKPKGKPKAAPKTETPDPRGMKKSFFGVDLYIKG